MASQSVRILLDASSLMVGVWCQLTVSGALLFLLHILAIDIRHSFKPFVKFSLPLKFSRIKSTNVLPLVLLSEFSPKMIPIEPCADHYFEVIR